MKKARRRVRHNQRQQRKRFQAYDNANSMHIKLKGEFSLFVGGERQKILKIIEIIKSKEHKRYLIDFSEVATLNPLTFLYLYHIIDKYGCGQFKTIGPKSLIPRGVFERFRLTQYFPMPPCPIHIAKLPEIAGWECFDGTTANFSDAMQAHIQEMQDRLDKLLFQKLIQGILGAVENVSHAYPDKPEYCKWFLMTNIDNKSISVVVSDLGVSVPYTVQFNTQNHLVDSASISDSGLIKLATKTDYSSTQMPNRGKGFNDIFELGNAELKDYGIRFISTMILSRHGSYVVARDHNKQIEHSLNGQLEDFPDRIDGTIIAWHIALI
ncbi:hypothetical protein LU290_07005 [Moraxella nasibovis]|uniref:hypothetical protein n=1 Tax=Moraxella nasibovis TaxID=2904120 RepID=UPI00240ED2E2|nr:hypothetical protein [Moraxella nasibovis]WFF38006.1 hypothetical protein LU290_07005 [Moraxella nasibovis]